MFDNRRFFVPAIALGIALLAFAFAGCASPDAVGVQAQGQITGRVIDAHTQTPIANALVSVGSVWSTRTDPSGAFNLMVSVGPQTVNVDEGGYLHFSQQVQVDQNTPVVLTIQLQPTM